MARAAVFAIVVLLAFSRAHAQVPDHLECYKVKDALGRQQYTGDLTGLVAESGCVIKTPAKFLCEQATKRNVAPPPPGAPGGPSAGRFVCYRIRCNKQTLSPVPVADQFGSRDLQPSRAKLLCAPVVQTAAPTTTTTTQVTTTTAPPGVCCNVSVDLYSAGVSVGHITDGCFMDLDSMLCGVLGPLNPNACRDVGGLQACLAGEVGEGVCNGATGFCSPTITGSGICCSIAITGTCLEGPDTPSNRNTCTEAGGGISVGTRCLPIDGTEGVTACQ